MMRSRYYVLNDHTPVPCSLSEWATWFETADHHVAHVNLRKGAVTVSTVFLGYDLNFSTGGPPILFETMVFGGRLDQEWECERYTTWDDAKAGHDAMVEKYRR